MNTCRLCIDRNRNKNNQTKDDEKIGKSFKNVGMDVFLQHYTFSITIVLDLSEN